MEDLDLQQIKERAQSKAQNILEREKDIKKLAAYIEKLDTEIKRRKFAMDKERGDYEALDKEAERLTQVTKEELDGMAEEEAKKSLQRLHAILDKKEKRNREIGILVEKQYIYTVVAEECEKRLKALLAEKDAYIESLKNRINQLKAKQQ